MVDERMQDEGCHGRKETHQQRQNDNEHSVADMLYPPLMQAVEPLGEGHFARFRCLHACKDSKKD